MRLLCSLVLREVLANKLEARFLPLLQNISCGWNNAAQTARLEGEDLAVASGWK
jgi:hypothetical protein